MNGPLAAGGKHALLIGIDRYPNLAESQQLKGCVNDARLLANVLAERFGFPAAGIVLLLNEAATRDGILAAFRDLLARVRPGDTVVVGYSGHGSRRRSADDPTGWDESLVPHDSGRAPHPHRDIADDEIHDQLVDLAGITPAVSLIFDSCFSGGILRDPFETGVRWVPPDERPAAPHPTTPRSHRPPSVAKGASQASGWRSLGDRYALIAGARYDESAREVRVGDDEPVHHGALTYFLCGELEKAGADVTSRDVFERAAMQVTAHFPGQHPQLEGAWDRELFGPCVRAPMRFRPVLAREGARAVLAGGAAHGLTRGSEWAVYPQGTRSISAETPCRGRLHICGVKAVTAEAEILDETGPGAIAAGDRAVEVAHDGGEMRLVVEVCGSDGDAATADLAALRRAIGASGLLRLAARGETGGARVYRVAARAGVRDRDPAPRLGPVQVSCWAAVGPDGRLLAPALPVGESGSLPRLIDNLEIHARQLLALAIENRDLESALRDRVAMRLLRREAGEWIPGAVSYREGDRLALEITNRSEHPIHVHVLDLGLTGRIALLYPVRGAREALLPERTLRIGDRRGEELELFIPDGFPFAAGGPAEGTEHLKILATLEPTDFGPLVQDGVRGAAVRASRYGAGPLERLLAAALHGGATREARPVQAAPRDDWTAVTRSFLLRR